MILSLINSHGELCFLDARNILFLQTNGQGELYFYTYEEKYRAVSMLKDWGQLLQREGFMQVDRGTIVNTKKIEYMDPILRVVRIPLLDGAATIPFTEKVRSKLREELISNEKGI